MLALQPTTSCCLADDLHALPHLVSLRSVPLRDGQRAVLRSAQPQDHALLQGLVQGLSPRTCRLRFFGRLPALGYQGGALTHTDSHGATPAAPQALLAVLSKEGRDQVLGDARFVRDGAGFDAEFALVVAEGWRRQGLGRALLLGLQQAAAQGGVRWLRGDVHLDDPAMHALLRRLGFRAARCDDNAGVKVFEKRLHAPR